MRFADFTHFLNQKLLTNNDTNNNKVLVEFSLVEGEIDCEFISDDLFCDWFDELKDDLHSPFNNCISLGNNKQFAQVVSEQNETLNVSNDSMINDTSQKENEDPLNQETQTVSKDEKDLEFYLKNSDNFDKRQISYCVKFNYAKCENTNCRFLHICSKCKLPHQARFCDAKNPCHAFNCSKIDFKYDTRGACPLTSLKCPKSHTCSFCSAISHSLVDCYKVPKKLKHALLGDVLEFKKLACRAYNV
jgi:hypothetical protein